jgi:hypothetical protein
MKILFLSFFLIVTLTAFSQSQWEIELSHEIPVPRMGKWVKGDYTVYTSLDTLSIYFRRCQHDITRSLEYYQDKDSNLANYFRATQNRYGTAATQLEKAANGFDLKKLRIYEGIENSNRNLEDFSILEGYVKNRVEQGKAIVMYKNERIYTLCGNSEMINQGRLDTVQDILNRGYEIRTFYDEPDNCLFIEVSILGW